MGMPARDEKQRGPLIICMHSKGVTSWPSRRATCNEAAVGHLHFSLFFSSASSFLPPLTISDDARDESPFTPD